MNLHHLKAYPHVEKALGLPDLMQSLYDEGRKVLMDQTLVTLHGEEHRARRLLEMRIFRRDFLRFYEEDVLPGLLEETLAPRLAAGRLEVVEFGYRVMIHLAIAFAGIDRQRFTDEESDGLLHMIRVFGKAATLGQLKGDPEPVRQEIREQLGIFERDFFLPSVQRRRDAIAAWRAGSLPEEELPRDILTVLLRNEDNLELASDVLRNEVAFFFLAGAHTSVHSLGHLVHHLLEWCEAHPEERALLEADALRVQRFAHESFRLHPSSPVARRRAVADTPLPDGSLAATGDTVVIDLRQANRDESVFGADAAAFNPLRRLPTGIFPHGITFGSGAHACLGKALAAGTVLRGEQAPAEGNHQIGTVATIAQRLLRAGARRDPAQEPRVDRKIERETWEFYPLLLGAAAPAGDIV